jgi:hypothetical protein
LTNNNYELIEEAKYFENLDVHGDYWCTSIQFPFLFYFQQQINILLLSLTFRSFCNRFSQEGLEGVYVQELNIKWQPIGKTRLLCGIIGVGFRVLVGQATCTTMGKVFFEN